MIKKAVHFLIFLVFPICDHQISLILSGTLPCALLMYWRIQKIIFSEIKQVFGAFNPSGESWDHAEKERIISVSLSEFPPSDYDLKPHPTGWGLKNMFYPPKNNPLDPPIHKQCTGKCSWRYETDLVVTDGKNQKKSKNEQLFRAPKIRPWHVHVYMYMHGK